ncbi:MAG: DUF4091 domain-containing protein [Planctomycetes bacterium]|nr:DUF4091 domain-containing protein [Planctomycetota bacterium]
MRLAAIGLLTLLVSCSGSFGAESAASIWCVGESTKVMPSDPPQDKTVVWDGASKTVKLGSARNEYVAFQIAVRTGKDPLSGVTVEPAALKGSGNAEIPAANIDLFVEHYLNVTVSSRSDANGLIKQCKAGEHPTQMVPFNAKKYGAPFEIKGERSNAVWVDIYVPEGAAPGVYKGAFKVKAGEAALGTVNVELEVWSFTLPHETHFHSFLYTGPENLRWGHHMGSDWTSDTFKALEDRYFQMAHQHRTNFNPSGGGIVDEIGKRYAKYYDGSAFTERVGKGVGQNVICASPEGDTKEAIQTNAKAIVAMLEEKKFPAFTFGYIWDEPHSQEDFDTSKQRCKWVHEAVGKKLRTFIATPQWQKYEAGDVDVYSEPSIADIPKIIERGDSVWAVNGGYGAGPYVDAPGYGGRSIVWMSWKMNLVGWQFWDCCYWVDKQNRKHKEGRRWRPDMTYAQINAEPEKYLTDLWNDPLNFDESRKKGYPMNDAIRINGDGLLYYPGHDIGIEGPIASFALKSLRRGAQDYEYLWLLKQKGKDGDAKAVVDSVCPEAGKWNDDPEAWDKARLKLAEMLSAAK